MPWKSSLKNRLFHQSYKEKRYFHKMWKEKYNIDIEKYDVCYMNI